MIRTTLIAVAFCTALASPVTAQPRDTASVDVLGDTIAGLMPESRRDWSMTWRAVGSRARLVHWHLAEPGPSDENGVQRRTGWVAAGGSQIGLAVCGDDEHVLKMVARMGGALPPSGAPALITALEASRVTLRMVNGARNALTYRLRQDERDDAHLVLSDGCTPEGSAAARRCWTTAEVFFSPTWTPVSRDAPEPAELCGMPGRH
jgi:hypothetical protein